MKDIYYEEQELATINQAINRLAYYSKTNDKFALFVQRIDNHLKITMDYLDQQDTIQEQAREDERLRLYEMNRT